MCRLTPHRHTCHQHALPHRLAPQHRVVNGHCLQAQVTLQAQDGGRPSLLDDAVLGPGRKDGMSRDASTRAAQHMLLTLFWVFQLSVRPLMQPTPAPCNSRLPNSQRRPGCAGKTPQ